MWITSYFIAKLIPLFGHETVIFTHLLFRKTESRGQLGRSLRYRQGIEQDSLIRLIASRVYCPHRTQATSEFSLPHHTGRSPCGALRTAPCRIYAVLPGFRDLASALPLSTRRFATLIKLPFAVRLRSPIAEPTDPSKPFQRLPDAARFLKSSPPTPNRVRQLLLSYKYALTH